MILFLRGEGFSLHSDCAVIAASDKVAVVEQPCSAQDRALVCAVDHVPGK